MNENDIGTAIAARRRLLGLKQEELAMLAGLSRTTVSGLENSTGARGSTIGSLLAVCKVLNLDITLTGSANAD